MFKQLSMLGLYSCRMLSESMTITSYEVQTEPSPPFFELLMTFRLLKLLGLMPGLYILGAQKVQEFKAC